MSESTYIVATGRVLVRYGIKRNDQSFRFIKKYLYCLLLPNDSVILLTKNEIYNDRQKGKVTNITDITYI